MITDHRRAVLLLMVCALLWSTAGVFTRLLTRAEASAGEMSLVAGLFRELERLKARGDAGR